MDPDRLNYQLSGKVALVTGATSGFGARFAEILAAQGCRVAIAARREELLNQLADKLRARGGDVVAVPVDMMKVDSIRACAAQVEKQFGPIDILVNNAGVSKQVPFLEVDEEFFDRLTNTNVKGVYFLAQAAAEQMVRNGRHGRIVNIASSAALRPKARLSVYGLTKSAVVHMTKTLALELGSSNINVNVICPGFIKTEMSKDFAKSPAGIKMLEGLPRRRAGEVEDLDALLLFLCSGEASRFITGAVISADDGFAAG